MEDFALRGAWQRTESARARRVVNILDRQDGREGFVTSAMLKRS